MKKSTHIKRLKQTAAVFGAALFLSCPHLHGAARWDDGGVDISPTVISSNRTLSYVSGNAGLGARCYGVADGITVTFELGAAGGGAFSQTTGDVQSIFLGKNSHVNFQQTVTNADALNHAFRFNVFGADGTVETNISVSIDLQDPLAAKSILTFGTLNAPGRLRVTRDEASTVYPTAMPMHLDLASATTMHPATGTNFSGKLLGAAVKPKLWKHCRLDLFWFWIKPVHHIKCDHFSHISHIINPSHRNDVFNRTLDTSSLCGGFLSHRSRDKYDHTSLFERHFVFKYNREWWGKWHHREANGCWGTDAHA